MKIKDILAKVKTTESPLARQLLIVGLISRLLEKKAALPENDTRRELDTLKEKVKR